MVNERITIPIPKDYEEILVKYKQVLQAQNLSYNTQNTYLLQVKKYLTVLEQVGDTQEAINIYLAQCKNSPYVGRSSLKSILQFMKREYKADISDLEIPKLRGRRTRQIKTCPANYIAKAIEVLPRNDDKMLIELAYYLALRSSEATHLRVSNFSFAKKTLTLIGKGDVEATVPISNDELLSKLKDYIRYKVPDYEREDVVAKKDWLFPKIACLKVPDRHFRYVMMLAGRQLREYYNPHALRHGRATSLYNFGMDTLSLKVILRHKSLVSTSIYAKPSLEKIRSELKKADGVDMNAISDTATFDVPISQGKVDINNKSDASETSEPEQTEKQD